MRAHLQAGTFVSVGNRLLKQGPLLSRELAKVMMAAWSELSRLMILIIRREKICTPADTYACPSFHFVRFTQSNSLTD